MYYYAFINYNLPIDNLSYYIINYYNYYNIIFIITIV